MRLSQLSYRTKQLIDFLLPATFVFFAFLWLTQAIFTIWIDQSLFTAMRLWLINLPMHTTTALNLTAIFLFSYYFFRTHLPGHQRALRAVLFTTIGVFFYDFIWSLCSITINGYGSFILPLVSFAIVLAYIVIMNRQTKIIKFNPNFIAPAIICFLITFGILVTSGFFQQFALYEQGLAIDPHGWEWLLNKTVVLWMWLSIALR